MATRAWGDDRDDDDDKYIDDEAGDAETAETKVIQREEIPQKDGTIRIIERYNDIDGNRIEVSKLVRLEKKTKQVKKSVLQRKNWFKFGDCKGQPPGPEMSITMVSNEKIHMDLSGKITAKDAKNPSIVVCPICGERGHFRFKCPRRNDPAFASKDTFASAAKKPAVPASSGAGAAAVAASGRGKDGKAADSSNTSGGRSKYVPPSQRAGHEELPTLRVTNISEVTTEQDLSELFTPFGKVVRIYLAKDHVSNRSRGFAFVTFAFRDNAEEAIERLNGYGYDNLILHVEWAKPREDKKDS